MTEKVLIAGAGPMGIAYAKVLQDLRVPFIAIGRGAQSAEKFKNETGVEALTGGIDAWLARGEKVPNRAIVAVTENNLGATTQGLLRKGVRSILVEKPGGFLPSDIRDTAGEADRLGARVWVGYNRRFYAATRQARQLIAADGGVSSFHFEFTEWSHVIEKIQSAPGVKEEWFLHNSTHIVDLAFHLCFPKMSYVAGSLAWHPR